MFIGTTPQVTIAANFPFYKADGSLDNIEIAFGQLPFFKADGTRDNIGVV